MTVRTTRRLLRLTVALASLATVGVVYRGLSGQLPEDALPLAQHPAQSSLETEPASVELVAMKDLRALWPLDLRRPLYDPAPPRRTEVKPAPPPLKLKLLGTIMEAANEQAILRTAAGQVETHRVGDIVDEAQIRQITPAAVVALYYEQIVTLSVSEETE